MPPRGADWAADFAQQQDEGPPPAEWVEQYQMHRTMEQLKQQARAAGLEDEKIDAELDTSDASRWAEAFDNEFKDGNSNFDWEAELEKIKANMPPLKDPEYEFTPVNPYASSQDPFSDGLRLFKEGDLKEAILAFEAAVQRNPDNSEAWRYLGQAQAENESETQAIAALLKAVTIDPYNLEALMMLGVSYTNDLEETRALNYLKTWLQQHPDYQGTTKTVTQYEQFYSGGRNGVLDDVLRNEVIKMFLDAVQINPRDPDLHTVLGVVYHISNDYDKAIECFRTAVQLKPDDPTLWNKLGATQANSSRSHEAVNAYLRALELKPNYVRASANLAISYANQDLHEEAARTYLRTLKQNPNADHIWGYLRISLARIGGDTLVDLSRQKNVELFRPYFEF